MPVVHGFPNTDQTNEWIRAALCLMAFGAASSAELAPVRAFAVL